MAATFKPWTPWGTPPADRYDPGLDAQLEASQRGYGDLITDAQTGNARDTQDYGFGVGNIGQQRTFGHEDIANQRADTGTSFDRGMQDIGTQRSQGTEDYNRNVGLLQRSYQQLGNRQAQQFRVAGVAGGGAALQAARKRSANQAIDRQPLDTGFSRLMSGLDTQQARLGENRDTQLGRLGAADSRLDTQSDQQLGQLGVNYQRGIDDRSTQVLRGGRESVFFGADTAKAKAFQAAGTGWDPGAKPKNEFVGASGPYRTIVRGGSTYLVDQAGKVLSKRRRAA